MIEISCKPARYKLIDAISCVIKLSINGLSTQLFLKIAQGYPALVNASSWLSLLPASSDSAFGTHDPSDALLHAKSQLPPGGPKIHTKEGTRVWVSGGRGEHSVYFNICQCQLHALYQLA